MDKDMIGITKQSPSETFIEAWERLRERKPELVWVLIKEGCLPGHHLYHEIDEGHQAQMMCVAWQALSSEDKIRCATYVRAAHRVTRSIEKRVQDGARIWWYRKDRYISDFVQAWDDRMLAR